MKKKKVRTVLSIGKDDAHYYHRHQFIGKQCIVLNKDKNISKSSYISCDVEWVGERPTTTKQNCFYAVKLSKEK